MFGTVVAVCTSDRKGVRKKPVPAVNVTTGRGIEGDAHAAAWHRQVSLLGIESIEKMRRLGVSVNPGDFAENVTTSGIALLSLAIGTRIKLGDVLLEVTQIGKECHARCEIYRQAGDCVMPREGIFTRVVRGGSVRPGDVVETAGQGA
ncbi:MAG TPA: MOSC domain-containing protein [Chloroflexota bacterium]